MNDIHSISVFIESLGAKFRVFDLGRRVCRLTAEDFLNFESTAKPYPYPLQQQAWFAILHWAQDRPQDQVVWFLKMPLDEQGLLVQVARDDFLRQLILGSGADEDSSVENSGYAFTPKEDRMAMFHALATRTLGQSPSSYYAHARDYLSGKLGYDQWSFVGLQGLADVVARIGSDDNQELIRKAVQELPDQPLVALCGLLENQAVDVRVAESLMRRLTQHLEQESVDVSVASALMRALASAKATGIRDQAVLSVLGSTLGAGLEVLVSIGGRTWEALQDEKILMAYLERLAESEQGQALFAQLVMDLLFVPGMRSHIMQGFRHPDRSDRLSEAIGDFMRAIST